jgi:hypothetical protein
MIHKEARSYYRCRLCHYTSDRMPLIRMHMRTHRQKVSFEVLAAFLMNLA